MVEFSAPIKYISNIVLYEVQQPYEESQIKYIHKLYHQKLNTESQKTYISINGINITAVPLILTQSNLVANKLKNKEGRLILNPEKIDEKSWNLIYQYLFGQKIFIKSLELRKIFRASRYLNLKRLSRKLLNLIKNDTKYEFDKDWIEDKTEEVSQLSDETSLLTLNNILFKQSGDEEIIVKQEEIFVKKEQKEEETKIFVKQEERIEEDKGKIEIKKNLKRKRDDNEIEIKLKK